MEHELFDGKLAGKQNQRRPILLRTPEVASLLAISPRTLWELTNRGEIPCRPRHGQPRFHVSQRRPERRAILSGRDRRFQSRRFSRIQNRGTDSIRCIREISAIGKIDRLPLARFSESWAKLFQPASRDIGLFVPPRLPFLRPGRCSPRTGR